MLKYFGGVTTDGRGFVAVERPFHKILYDLEDGTAEDLTGRYSRVLDTWDLKKEDYDHIRAVYLRGTYGT